MPNPSNNQNATNDDSTREDANTNVTADDNSTNNAATNDDASANANSAPANTQPTPEYVTLDAFNEMRDTLTSFQDTINQIMGGIKAIKDAQGVMVRAGMIVQDDSQPDTMDDFTPLSELDFSVKR